MNDLCGVINIRKEKGYTSHDVVAIVRKLFGRVKTGHTGTLDPAAEGVLPICLGRATRISDYIMSETKGYRAVVKLGTITDTEDDTGNVLETHDVNCGFDEIKTAAISFIGGYEQIPPMYSAIKVGGKKLYQMARKGEDIARAARKIEIYDIRIVEVLDSKSFVIDIECSKGTYIRTLCADIGKRLGCGACMGALTRYRSGDFLLENSTGLAELKEAAEAGEAEKYLMPVESVLHRYKRANVGREYEKPLYNGNAILLSWLKNSPDLTPDENVLIFDDDNKIVGIYKVLLSDTDIIIKPAVMLR